MNNIIIYLTSPRFKSSALFSIYVKLLDTKLMPVIPVKTLAFYFNHKVLTKTGHFYWYLFGLAKLLLIERHFRGCVCQLESDKSHSDVRYNPT